MPLTHSAPARVLPAPRPPSRSHVRQGSPFAAAAGGRWYGAANESHYVRMNSDSSGFILASKLARSLAFKVIQMLENRLLKFFDSSGWRVIELVRIGCRLRLA
jgi:hypothetical protein